MERSQQIRVWMRLLFILFIVSVLGTMMFYYAKSNYQMVVAKEREDLDVFTTHLELNLNTRLMSMQLMAENPRIKSLEPEVTYNELVYSRDILKFSNMAVFDKQGILIREVLHTGSMNQIYEKDLYRILAGKQVITDVMVSTTSPAAINLYVPIHDDTNQVKAVLTGEIVLDELAKLIEDDMPPANRHLFIEDGNGDEIYYPGIKNKEDFFRDVKFVYDQQFGVEEVDKSIAYHEDKIYIYNILDHSNWRIVMVMPVNEIYIMVLQKSIPHIALLLLMMLCAGLLYRNFVQDRCSEENMRRFRMERLMSVNQLAAGLAHEIRNPLTSIKGFIQLMIIKKDIVPNQSHMQIILAEIDRIDKLVNEFQRLTRPLKTPQFVKIDIEQMIHEVIILMEGQAVKKNLILTFSNKGSRLIQDYVGMLATPLLNRPCYILGDEAQLKQVIINLVKNAIDAVDKNGEVEFGLSVQDNIASITIRDNGIGMSEGVLKKIGTPFFTTKDGGNGLGLSVCYNIIEGHGGAIEVNSEVGKGTVFTVKLPCLSQEGRL